MAEKNKYQIIVVGGGTGGIAIASHLVNLANNAEIAIIEPADTHYYQPGWTMVGAGILKNSATARPMQSVIPKKTTWLQDSVASFEPEENKLMTTAGKEYHYDFLVIAAGIQIDWDKISGLKDNLGKNGVISIYDFEQSANAWENIRSFGGGNAVFTQPEPPFKCPGAAQKIMYLTDDVFRKNKIRSQSDIRFYSAAPGIFPVKKFADALNQVIARKELKMNFQHTLTAIDGNAKTAVFKDKIKDNDVEVKFDLLHVTPPMSAPAFISASSLSDANGWLDVDMYTLRHKTVSNVFGLGDCTNTPNGKTAAAIRSQTPVLVSNLMTAMSGQEGKAAYDGYASCPLITGYGKLILAEFDYNLQPKETFPFDQGKERRSMYYLKRYVLPKVYWNVLLKGGDFSLGAS